MRRIFLWMSLFFIFAFSSFASEDIIAFCFHDVRDQVFEHYDPDTTAVSTANLVAYFSWLKEHGYVPISIDEILMAKAGKRDLPEKPVLLTFDDGLKSVYSRVFPILKLFRYPAVVNVEVSWIESKKKNIVQYGEKQLGYGDFLTWEQVKEMVNSGLVEIGTHSYDLHKGVLGNPQGNIQPAATTRIYDPESKTYEGDDDYTKRIETDLLKSIETIEKQTGIKPRVIAWPFGEYNKTTMKIAQSIGLEINLSLTSKKCSLKDFPLFGRILISHNPFLDDFLWDLRHPEVSDPENDPLRVVQVDIDRLYDEDEVRQKRNLDSLLERINKMRINTVYLQAFADPDGNGVADALYFPNRHLPVRADLFNRIAWQLKTRSEVKVYAWMPVIAFNFQENTDLSHVDDADQKNRSFSGYQQVSIFDSDNKAVILEIYEDLAKHADFEGILFHEDAYFNDYKDGSVPALQYNEKNWGFSSNLQETSNDSEALKSWSEKKIAYLIDLTNEIKERVEVYRAPVTTARNIHAHTILEEEYSLRFTQSYALFLENYDYMVIMAMPYMEKAKNARKWLMELVEKAKVHDPNLNRTVFKLQAFSWSQGELIPTSELLKQMEILQLQGALNIGYYPDDFIRDHPELKRIRIGISLETYPYVKK